MSGANSLLSVRSLIIGQNDTQVFNVAGGGNFATDANCVGYNGWAGSTTLGQHAPGSLVIGENPGSNGTLNISGGSTFTAGSPTTGTTYVGYIPYDTMYGSGSGTGGTGRINFGAGGGTLNTGSLMAPATSLTGTGVINCTGLVPDFNVTLNNPANVSASVPFGTGGTLNLLTFRLVMQPRELAV